ncbi:hypothetical protein DFS30_01875 [Akkermansia muciniphila]|nr:hypothetical protein CUC06_01795 [Akkermansia muciniphila]MBE5696993.1 hypothetical protein [Akkermansia sp.]KAA3323493.1 hypothetical protein F1937_02750 [Akkermansia muciniphila]KAA3325160.1 hypothetical protein F1963_01430 [Akkermansia muciniphila]KAA3326172.1 hypothetical protein F1931_01430 [Akkermansia muciniphila]
MPGSIHTYPEIDCLCRAVPYHAGGIKNTLLSPMNIRTHIQALLICTLPLSAQGQSIVDSRASLPRAVQLHGDEGRETVRPDESKRISPNEAPASRVQPQRIVNRIAATVNGRPITANEVSVRLMPIGAQLAAQYPKQGPEFYKQLALAKKNIIEDLVERELLRNEFEGMGGVIRDSLIDQEVNRTILTTFNGDRSAFLKNLSLSGMTIRAFREMTKKQLQVQIMRASKYDQEIPPTPEEIQQEYESTKEQYRDLTKDKIKFKKIFIPMLGDDSASTPEVQLNLAELIAKEIKSKNATFEEMAKRYSKDLYAEKGGDWPVTERSTLSPESAAIIFGAQPGEIIGPLVDSTGFTIVLVEKKELAPPPPLSAIKEQIDIMARNKRSNERYKKWVERLRKKAIVKIYI